MIAWRDVLHEGPVPAVPDVELRRIRADFLGGVGAGDVGTLAEFTARDRMLEDFGDGAYMLWFEADLYDQLQLIQILAKLRELAVAPCRITLVCIGEHVGIAHFGGLGDLDAERRILAAIAGGTTTAGAAFARAAAKEARPFLGDSWCFDRMTPFARATTPLLARQHDDTTVRTDAQVQLTSGWTTSARWRHGQRHPQRHRSLRWQKSPRRTHRRLALARSNGIDHPRRTHAEAEANAWPTSVAVCLPSNAPSVPGSVRRRRLPKCSTASPWPAGWRW